MIKSETRHPYTLPRYVDNPKRPYVVFYAYSNVTLKSERCRVYHPPEHQKGHSKGRWKRATIAAIENLLKEGYVFVCDPPEMPPKVRMNESLSDRITRENRERRQSAEAIGTAAMVPRSALGAVRWAAKAKEVEVNERTREANKNVCARLAGFLAGIGAPNLTLAEFNHTFAAQFGDYMMRVRGVKARTRNNYMGLLQSLFSSLTEIGAIKVNPFHEFRRLKQDMSIKNVAMTSTQVDALTTYLEKNDPSLLFVCRLIYYTFARPIELYRMKVSEVDLATGMMYFAAETTKSGKRGEVKLPAAAREMLAGYLAENVDQSLFLIGLRGPGTSKVGDETFRRRHLQALRAVGLDGLGIGLYSWKHTGVCAAFDKGMQLAEISARCRHANMTQTETYLRDFRRSRPAESLVDW